MKFLLHLSCILVTTSFLPNNVEGMVREGNSTACTEKRTSLKTMGTILVFVLLNKI